MKKGSYCENFKNNSWGAGVGVRGVGMNVNEDLKFLRKCPKNGGGVPGSWRRVGLGESGWISEVFVKIQKNNWGRGRVGVVSVDVNEEAKFLRKYKNNFFLWGGVVRGGGRVRGGSGWM